MGDKMTSGISVYQVDNIIKSYAKQGKATFDKVELNRVMSDETSKRIAKIAFDTLLKDRIDRIDTIA
jgi:hypothetical protein